MAYNSSFLNDIKNSDENGFEKVKTKKSMRKNRSTYKNNSRTPSITRDIISSIQKDEFKDFLLRKGPVGRIGVVPWYQENNSSRKMVVLSISNLLYLSDFGGGLKESALSPYHGLELELRDEVGKYWTEYLLKCIRQKPTLIFLTTDIYSTIPFNILLFVRIDKNELDRLNFKLTKEVRNLEYLTMEQFHYIVDNKSSATSNGLRMYKDFREYLEKKPELVQQVNNYFEHDTTHKVNNINISKIELLENIKFNSNLNIAYKKRKKHIKTLSKKNKKNKNK
jgi:hypothetical protein